MYKSMFLFKGDSFMSQSQKKSFWTVAVAEADALSAARLTAISGQLAALTAGPVTVAAI